MGPADETTRLRLKTLIEINRLMMGTLDPDDLLNVILRSTAELFSAAACSLALVDKDGLHVVFTKAVGGKSVVQMRLEPGQGIAGWVAQKGTGVICNDVTRDPRFFKGIDEKTGFQTESILCAPLKHQDTVIGVLEVLNTSMQGRFDEDDFELLLAFAGVAAIAIVRARDVANVRNINASFQEIVDDRYRLVLGQSTVMQEAIRVLRAAAATDTSILILGESGTGKEVLAHAVHRWSLRADRPFVTVNCGTLTPPLLESELFGHEKGAFTGAIRPKKGKFELADGGTLFFDEIGELAPHLQAKLLRALQEREIQRVGGEKDIRVDVRIIAATNRNLQEAVKNRAFRVDLYYRLNVVSAALPPLRDRREDIPALVDYFLEYYCQQVKRAWMGIEPAALKALQAHNWRGNVRELQNVIERCTVLLPGPNITLADLPTEIQQATSRL